MSQDERIALSQQHQGTGLCHPKSCRLKGLPQPRILGTWVKNHQSRSQTDDRRNLSQPKSRVEIDTQDIDGRWDFRQGTNRRMTSDRCPGRMYRHHLVAPRGKAQDCLVAVTIGLNRGSQNDGNRHVYHPLILSGSIVSRNSILVLVFDNLPLRNSTASWGLRSAKNFRRAQVRLSSSSDLMSSSSLRVPD